MLIPILMSTYTIKVFDAEFRKNVRYRKIFSQSRANIINNIVENSNQCSIQFIVYI